MSMSVRVKRKAELWGLRVVELTFNELTGGNLTVSKTCEPTQGLLAGQTGFCEVTVTNFGLNSVLNVVLNGSLSEQRDV